MFSQTYAAIIVMVLANFLPKIGVTVGNDDLTTTISVLATVAAGLWAAYRRYQAGGITSFGVRTK